jgi:outer membrane protein
MKKLILKGLLFTCLLVAAPVAVHAEEELAPVSYTLDECITLALSRSPEVLTAAQEIRRATAYIFENWSSIVSLSADGTYTSANPNIGSLSYEQYDLGVNASLPLFTGGRTLWSLNIAYMQREIAREQYRSAVSSTIYDTRTAFYSVLLAQRQVAVWEEEVRVLTRNLENTEKNFRSGLAPKYDVNRIAVELANARTSLIQSKNDLVVAFDSLKKILDLDLDKPIELTGELNFLERDKALDEYLSAAETGSPELRIKKLSERIASKNVLVAIGNYFPTISAFAQYNTSSVNDLNISFDEKDWEFVGGISISIPISDLLTATAKKTQAKAEYEEAKIDTDNTDKEIKLSIRKAYFNLEVAKEIINLQKSNVDLAEENLERSELRYVNGVETLLELLDARLAVTQARLNYINAIYTYEESLSLLNRIAGYDQTQE